MSKLYVFNLMTIDGFFEGPNRDISWHNVDEEFNEYAINQLNLTGLLVFGRITYELMASYWPTPAALRDDPIVAGKMNSMPKIVCSKTLSTVAWNNTRLVKEDVMEEVADSKRQEGKDIAVFGSANLTQSLLKEGLVDELRIIVNPVILGSGNTLFSGLQKRLDLKPLGAKVFRNGNVLLRYQPAR